MSADVVQIRRIGQCVLRNDTNIAAVERLIFGGLAVVRRETFAKNHVSGAEAAGVSASEKDGVLRHRRKQRFAIRTLERRGEHVMAKPIAEHVPALITFEPMGQSGIERQGGKYRQRDDQRGETPTQTT